MLCLDLCPLSRMFHLYMQTDQKLRKIPNNKHLGFNLCYSSSVKELNFY